MARTTLTSALNAALRHVPTRPADAATVQLAQRYAADLDNGADLAKLGPQLLAVLAALGMTPAARAAITGKGAAGEQPADGPLDELRRRRQRRAAAVDPAAG